MMRYTTLMAYKNKEDQARNARKHYEANREKIKQRAREHKKKNQAIAKEYIELIKSVPCMDCRQKFPTIAMDFDHIRDKHMPVSQMVNAGLSLNRIKEEIEKCEVVCSNCHRIRTQNRRSKSGD